MTLGERQEIFLVNAARFILWISSQGYRVRGGELWRPAILAKIYSGLYGIVEKATGVIEWFAKRGIKRSLHIDKLAIDLNLFKDGKYLSNTEDHKPLGEWWEQQHPENRWGGRYGDGNHYEMVPGYINDYWKNKEGNAS